MVINHFHNTVQYKQGAAAYKRGCVLPPPPSLGGPSNIKCITLIIKSDEPLFYHHNLTLFKIQLALVGILDISKSD